jgi:hypothetical protein
MTMATIARPHRSPKFREIFADLSEDVAALVHDELDLVKRETRAEVRSTAIGLGISAVLSLAALLSFCAAGVLALTRVLHPAWAALAVGGALAVIAMTVALVATRGWRQHRKPKLLRDTTIDVSQSEMP